MDASEQLEDFLKDKEFVGYNFTDDSRQYRVCFSCKKSILKGTGVFELKTALITKYICPTCSREVVRPKLKELKLVN